MLRTFEIRGSKFVNFDLDDPETISMLKNEYGVTEEEISKIKNAPELPTTEERLEALELAMLEMVLKGGAGDGSVSSGAGETGTNNA